MDFGLFDKKHVKHPLASTDEDRRLALLLYNGLVKTRKVKKVNKLDSWAKEIKLIRRDFDATPNDIEAAINWYIAHISDEYVPMIRSGSSLRMKYDALVEAIRRSNSATSIDPDLEITDNILAISTRLKLSWPGREKKSEPLFLQASWNAYDTYRTQLRELRTSLIEDKHSPVSSFNVSMLNYVIAHTPTVSEIVESHVKEINRMAWKWEGWKGDLLAWTLNPHSKEVQRLYMMRAAEYCGNGEKWDVIKQLLKQSA